MEGALREEETYLGKEWRLTEMRAIEMVAVSPPEAPEVLVSIVFSLILCPPLHPNIFSSHLK